jgi:hypothetical protein
MLYQSASLLRNVQQRIAGLASGFSAVFLRAVSAGDFWRAFCGFSGEFSGVFSSKFLVNLLSSHRPEAGKARSQF